MKMAGVDLKEMNQNSEEVKLESDDKDSMEDFTVESP
jgi:hypothetical protein